MYNDVEGQSICKSCDVGKFSDSTRQDSCVNCPSGYNSPNVASASCESCDAGKFGDSCAECAAGQYRGTADNSAACKQCPKGEYQDNEGQAACLPCVPGMYNDVEGQSICKSCDVGKFSNMTNSKACYNCVAGKYATSTGTVRCSSCIAGRAGRHCDKCKPGLFRAGDDEYTFSCHNCPEGFSQHESEGSVCYPCIPGRYAKSKGSTTCAFCPAGFIQEGTKGKECSKVPDGEISGKSRTSTIEVTLGFYLRDCDENNVCEGYDACPPGTKGTFPKPSRECLLCPAGSTSARGSVTCIKCEPGKANSLPGSGNCTRCNLDRREFSKYPGAERCDKCKPGSYSTGQDCIESSIDKSLPFVEDVPRVQLVNSSDYRLVKISWQTPADFESWEGGDRLQFNVEFSKSSAFREIDGLPSSSITSIIADKNYKVQNVLEDIRNTNIFFRVRIITSTGKTGGWSPISEGWQSLGSGSCFTDTLYLGTSSLNPLDWSCQPCPQGADCSGSCSWEGITALFGWWRIPKENRSPENVFAKCMYPPACQGATNLGLVDRYPETKEPKNESCAEHIGFREGSRLCHRCKIGYKRKGFNRCERCPDSTQANLAVILLGGLLLVLVLAHFISSSIKDAGKTELSGSLQKIVLNYLQVATLFEEIPLQWPKAVETMFDMQGAVSTLGDHLVNPDCIVGEMSPSELYFKKQLVFASLPFCVCLASFCFWAYVGNYSDQSFFAKRQLKDEVTTKDKFVITMTSVGYLIFPTLCKNAFGLFRCTQIGNVFVFTEDMELTCFEGSHLFMVLALGLSQIILFVLSMPLLVLLFLRRNRKKLDRQVTLVRYGLFYGAYDRSRYFWEIFLTWRKLFVVILLVFGPYFGVEIQAQLLLILLVLCICEYYSFSCIIFDNVT